MSTTCSVASFKQIANHANLSSNTNGFCANLNQTVAASLSDRGRFAQAPNSFTLLGKPIPFIFSTTLPLEESIKEKFKNLHNTSVLSDSSRGQGQEAYDREVLEYCTQGDLKVPSVPIGLTNFSNHCYQNSTLQTLLATGPLLYFVMEKHKPAECPLTKRSEFCSLCGVHRLVRSHYKETGMNTFKTITPSYFRCNLGSNVQFSVSFLTPLEFGSFSHYSQEDAQEYLNGVLSSFVNCFDKAAGNRARSKNIIEKMFFGSTLHLHTCSSCRNVSWAEEPYCNLPLPMEGSCSLQHILAKRKGLEVVEDYVCSVCKNRATVERRDLILKAPPILTFYLLRFAGINKNNNYIRFPLTFDLRPYMASASGPSLNYQLYAIINHEGNGTHCGHYVACTNHGGTWYEISDSDVTQVDVQQVLAKKPYILFYKLVNPEDVLCFPEDIENVRKEVIAAAAARRSSSPAPQISNNSINQKLVFPWRSPHGPPLINSSNSAALFPPATPRPSTLKFNSNVPLLRHSTSTLPYVGSSLKRSHSVSSSSAVLHKTQKFDLYNSGSRCRRSWSEKRFRDKRKHCHGRYHHHHIHKHKEKRRH